MPFIEVSIDNTNLINNQEPRRKLLAQIVDIVAQHLSCMMPDGTYNVVPVTDIDVRIHFIDISKGESQAKSVVIKVGAIGYPDRMADKQNKGDAIHSYLAAINPEYTFGVWLDLKPDAVWSE